MSILNKLAHAQNRRDDVPNQELAKELVDRTIRMELERLRRIYGTRTRIFKVTVSRSLKKLDI